MYFDEVALKWDDQRRSERARMLAGFITNNLPNATTYRALEVGCGTGLLTLNLAKDFKEIVCMDTSKEMIRIVSAKNDLLNNSNIHIIDLDEFSQTNWANHFDVIYSSMVLHHISDIKTEFLKWKEWLRPNGYLIIIDLDKEDGLFHIEETDFNGHNGFYQEDLDLQLKECGYSNVIIQTIYKGTKQVRGNEVPYSLFLCKANFHK